MENISNKPPISIYMEAVPNPNSLKFVVNYMLVPEGATFDFPNLASTANAPLAQALFNFSFVSRVFYMSNFITITKVDNISWDMVQNELRDFIKAYLEADKEILKENSLGNKEEKQATIHANTITEKENEQETKIKFILEEYIKPAVEQDGGAISFHSFQDGIVKVLLHGACSGCPSSTMTLKAGIERLLKSEVQGVKAVEAEGI